MKCSDENKKGRNAKMDLFRNVIRKIEGYFTPKLMSPVPENDTLNTAGKLNYIAENQGRQAAASQPSSFTPQTIKYPDWMANAPTNKTVTPTPTGKKPVVTASVKKSSTSQRQLEELIKAGLRKYSPGVPIANEASTFAEAGQGLPDPLLPVLVALAETSGGKNITRGSNNLFNLLPTPAGVDYPDMRTAILGGNGRQGFKGTITGGLYNDYLKSGNLADFLRRYTPPGAEHGNADLEQQMANYSKLRSYFE